MIVALFVTAVTLLVLVHGGEWELKRCVIGVIIKLISIIISCLFTLCGT